MTAVTPGSAELLALADQIERDGVTVYGPWHPYETVKQMIVGALRLAAKPDEDGVRIPYDAKVKLGYVWLIWGVTAEGRVDLVAIATTEEARDRYIEAGNRMGKYRAVKDEQAYVDHLFGGGLLKAINNSRRALSTTGEPKP